MALETVATHLADLGETRARTREYESSTSRRDLLAPLEAEKKELDNDTARLILSELNKDVAYNDIVRDNKITSVSTLRDYYKSRGPEGLLADLTVAQEKVEFENRYDIMVASNDLILNEFSTLHAMAERHFQSLGDPEYDSSAGLNQLETFWDRFTQKMIENKVAEQRPGFDKASGQQTEETVWGVGMLPGGRSQNEPLSAEDLPGMDKHLEIMKEVSRMGKDAYIEQQRQAGQTERQRIASGAAGDAPDPTSVTETGGISGQMSDALLGLFPDSFAVDDEKGTVTVAEGYGGSIQAINNWATEQVTSLRDKFPKENLSGLQNQVLQHLGNNIEPYQSKEKTYWGMAGGEDPYTYNTFIPTKGSDSLRRDGITQLQYIQKLEEMIKINVGRRDAQSLADEHFRNNFSNMVTISTQ